MIDFIHNDMYRYGGRTFEAVVWSREEDTTLVEEAGDGEDVE